MVTYAVTVKGTRLAERSRSKAQWYEPCVLEGGGKVVGSFTVPLYTAIITFRCPAKIEESSERTTTRDVE